MKQFLPIIVIVMLCALGAGCTGVPSVQTHPAPGSGSIVPGTTDTLPSASNVVIQVAQKDSIHKTIDVTFAGGAGQTQVQRIDVIYTGSDGATRTQQLAPEKGATVTIQGTDKTDRIQVYVTLYTGTRYLVVNQTSPYQTPS